MTAAELRPLDDASLKRQLDEFEHEMFNLRFQRAAGQLPNFNRLNQLKRDIARVKTVIHDRERAAKMEGKAK